MAEVSTELQIDDLANHPQYLEPLSTWYHQSFLHLTDPLTLKQRQYHLNQHLERKLLPRSFVAIKKQRLLGGLCLVEHDIKSHLNYSPWLSRIFVHPQARGQSVATSLIEHAVHYIQGLGHEQLFLLTEHKQLFFSQKGFEEIDVVSLNGFPLSIMMLDLSKN